jgi:ABC-type transport system involved in multi-copper enzyme maturation permease subunit
MSTGTKPAADQHPETGGGDRFGRLVRAEWTKLRSVPRWMMALAAVVGLTVLVALIDASDRGGDTVEEGEPLQEPDFADQFHFVHQPLDGDGSIVARVVSQEDSHEWAKAGVMVKERLEVGAPYTALLVTPDHGVRMQWGFEHDVAGSEGGAAPRWLRLTRAGDTVTGYESADASDWQRVGEVDLDDLPSTVEVGLFVTSPYSVVIERQYGSNTVNETPTRGEAVFDNVSVEPADGPPPPGGGDWDDYDTSDDPRLGGSTESDGVFTLMGSGDIAEVRRPFGDDLVQLSLEGVAVGILAAAALGALFMTAEFKRGMIRTTFAACPGRGRVLAAKAVVLGGATFSAGLVASVVAFLVSAASLRTTSRDPGLPELSLANLTVLRAVVGTAVLVALVAVLSLAVASIVRHTALAVPLVVLPLLVPSIVSGGLPLSVENWLTRLTPAAGFAVQQTITRYDTAIAPLVGLGVMAAYAAAALGVATVLLRRRDA